MTASFAEQEIWHVLVATDDMKRMNVDQLDDAYRLDIVDSSTLVWKNGMEKWRRLGSIAGIEEEPETIARPIAPTSRPLNASGRPFGPPSHPPPPRPRQAPPAPHAPRPTTRAVNPFDATVSPFASTTPAGVFTAPQLLAPVYTPQLVAPDPYVLPKRRARIDSDVDFRRSSGVHWGRWLLAFVLLTGGVLGAYRQNYLREGARRLGVENKYLAGERRAVAWVDAKAPGPLKVVLTQAKLLPGPNATPAVAPAAPAPVAAPAVAAAPATESSKPSTPSSDSEVKTVSLDSLPTEPAAAPATEAAALPRSAPAARPAPAARATRSAPVAVEKPEPKAAPAPRKEKVVAETEAPVEKPKPAAPKGPPPSMNSPLNAAIWASMQADAKKK